MFEEIDFYPEEALGVLCIEKLLYDHLGIVTDSSIDADYLYACMEEAIFEIVQDVWYKYSEVMQMSIAHIVFPSMRPFYDLCREHSRRHRINFKRNPYVLEAAKVVDEHMRNIDNYDVGWRLCTPKKEYPKKHCELVVYTGMEFYQPVELVESLCEIREFYIEAEKKLRLELYGSKTGQEPAPPLLPAVPERRAA
mgnify:CR=1 FL=1